MGKVWQINIHARVRILRKGTHITPAPSQILTRMTLREVHGARRAKNRIQCPILFRLLAPRTILRDVEMRAVAVVANQDNGAL